MSGREPDTIGWPATGLPPPPIVRISHRGGYRCRADHAVLESSGFVFPVRVRGRRVDERRHAGLLVVDRESIEVTSAGEGFQHLRMAGRRGHDWACRSLSLPPEGSAGSAVRSPVEIDSTHVEANGDCSAVRDRHNLTQSHGSPCARRSKRTGRRLRRRQADGPDPGPASPDGGGNPHSAVGRAQHLERRQSGLPAHQAAAFPGIEYAISVTHVLEDGLIFEPFEMNEGFHEVPRTPGLGVSLDPDAIEECRIV